MYKKQTVSVFEYNIFAGSMDALLDGLKEDIEQNKCNKVFAMNPNKVILAVKNPAFKKVLLDADVLIADGSGLIRAAKMFDQIIEERITGIDLMQRCCEMAAVLALPVFLYGATEEVVCRTEDVLKMKFANLSVVGYHNGYDSDLEGIVKKINESGARILFVALGSPAQEEFIHQYGMRLPGINLSIGVGGSFDVIAGNVKRAPKSVRKLNLEWLYRIIKQPWRIGKYRFLPQFVIYTLRAKWRNKNGS